MSNKYDELAVRVCIIYTLYRTTLYVVGPTSKILRTRRALRFPAGGPCVILFTVKPRREGVVKQTSRQRGRPRRGTEKLKKKKNPFRLLIMTKYEFPRAAVGDARSFYRTLAVYHVTFTLLLLLLSVFLYTYNVVRMIYTFVFLKRHTFFNPVLSKKK